MTGLGRPRKPLHEDTKQWMPAPNICILNYWPAKVLVDLSSGMGVSGMHCYCVRKAEHADASPAGRYPLYRGLFDSMFHVFNSSAV